MRLIGEMYQPAIAFLPIGDLYTMGPEQAAKACELLGVKQVVPMHYGTFPALTGTPARLRELVEPRGVQVLELQPRARRSTEDTHPVGFVFFFFFNLRGSGDDDDSSDAQAALHQRRMARRGRRQTIEVVNPATEEVIAEVASAEQGDVDAAVAAARAAFDGPWGKLSARERGGSCGRSASG